MTKTALGLVKLIIALLWLNTAVVIAAHFVASGDPGLIAIGLLNFFGCVVFLFTCVD